MISQILSLGFYCQESFWSFTFTFITGKPFKWFHQPWCVSHFRADHWWQ